MSAPSQLAKNIAAAKQSQTFNDETADIVILSSGHHPKLFKVHEDKLAAGSTVFRDMLDLDAAVGDAAPADERFQGLPVVQLAETSSTLQRFLHYFSNDIDSFPNAAQMDWESTIDLLEACIKYDMIWGQALIEAQTAGDIAGRAFIGRGLPIGLAFRLYTLACRAQRRTVISKTSMIHQSLWSKALAQKDGQGSKRGGPRPTGER